MDNVEEKTAFDKILDFEAPGTPIESSGTWSSLKKGLVFTDEQQLATYIDGKTVLDVGSGMGGFFKEAKVRGNGAKIININPRFAIRGFAEEAHEAYEMMAADVPENIKELNKLHDENAVAAFSNRLPIKDASIGVIVDNKGAVYHCLYEDRLDDITHILYTTYNPNEQALSETIDEYKRVLEKNGKARIGGLLPQPELEKGLELFKTKLVEKGLKFTEIKDEGGENVAIEIEKSN